MDNKQQKVLIPAESLPQRNYSPNSIVVIEGRRYQIGIYNVVVDGYWAIRLDHDVGDILQRLERLEGATQ